jgi:catechol 2,3-dioxygenase-like lactoylglutathione lyase family enzyme
MKQLVTIVLAVFFCFSFDADEQHPRPRILGIARVEFYSTNIAAARDFYSQILRPEGACLWCEQIPRSPLGIVLGWNQALILATPRKTSPANMLYEIDFAVDDVNAMRAYLAANKVEVIGDKKDSFPVIIDPEGHRIGFVQSPSTHAKAGPGMESMHLIHAGFVVQNRNAEDRFYRDLLGFHVYWHGGMKDQETNWVDVQVPDGTDWIEYMLNVPANADKHTLGVMNHIALGVPDIHAATKQLLTNGMKLSEEPHIGRDGKWQLNLYDPDDTRVELMEFTPVEKPCCSDYTGPHPKP